jgi:ATP-dependent Clp protease ATP-binding subunit ClpC
MFERYTEKARRIIFVARHEASVVASPYIETEHLLLGLLREDIKLALRVLKSEEAIAAVREQFEREPPAEPLTTSVDLPLSHASKRVLAYGAEESERMKHRTITPGHLLIGLLREEDGEAAKVLRARGVQLGELRELVAKTPEEDRPAAAQGREALHKLLNEIPPERLKDVARLLEAMKDNLVSVSVTGSRGSFTFSYRTGRIGND